MPETDQMNATPPSPQSNPGSTADPIASPQAQSGSNTGNTSGQGSGATVPVGVKGWGWGPFSLTWVWAIGNNVWIGLLALIPYIGLIMAVVLGVKGREWAWQAKSWDSVEHFNKVQRNWSIAGFILGVLIFIAILAITILITVVAIDPAQRLEEQQRDQQLQEFKDTHGIE